MTKLFLDGQQLSLSASPPTNGSFCPGTVQFTCTGTNVAAVLEWKINGSIVTSHVFRLDDKFPLVVPPKPSAPEGFKVTILAAILIDDYRVNITSVLRGNVADLRGSTVYCADPITSSNEQYCVEAQGKLLAQLHLSTTCRAYYDKQFNILEINCLFTCYSYLDNI